MNVAIVTVRAMTHWFVKNPPRPATASVRPVVMAAPRERG
jgi:hypothetical protein